MRGQLLAAGCVLAGCCAAAVVDAQLDGSNATGPLWNTNVTQAGSALCANGTDPADVTALLEQYLPIVAGANGIDVTSEVRVGSSDRANVGLRCNRTKPAMQPNPILEKYCCT